MVPMLPSPISVRLLLLVVVVDEVSDSVDDDDDGSANWAFCSLNGWTWALSDPCCSHQKPWSVLGVASFSSPDVCVRVCVGALCVRVWCRWPCRVGVVSCGVVSCRIVSCRVRCRVVSAIGAGGMG